MPHIQRFSVQGGSLPAQGQRRAREAREPRFTTTLARFEVAPMHPLVCETRARYT
jgi:hypothetical protein